MNRVLSIGLMSTAIVGLSRSGVLDCLLRLNLPERADALARAKRQTTKDQIPIVDADCL